MRKQEKIFFSVKDYEKAELQRRLVMEREIDESHVINEKIKATLMREEDKLRAKQQASLQTLLKRIQRDRDE